MLIVHRNVVAILQYYLLFAKFYLDKYSKLLRSKARFGTQEKTVFLLYRRILTDVSIRKRLSKNRKQDVKIS